jgi:hypothetical protein
MGAWVGARRARGHSGARARRDMAVEARGADADEVLVVALRAAGISETLDDVRAYEENAGELARVVRACVVRVDETWRGRLAETFPSDDEGVGERFRCAGAYAEAMRGIGYEGEDGDGFGFQQFLYPTEASARGMLKFLLEKLPRKETEVAMRGDVGTSTSDGAVSGEGRRNDRGRARRAVTKSTRTGEAWGRAQTLAGFAGIAAAASAKKRMDDFEEAKTFRSVRLETTAEGGFFGNLRDSELSALPSILEFSSQSRAETERDEDAQRLRFGGIERLEIIGPDGQPFDLRKRGGLRGLIAEIFALALRGGFYSEQHVRKARRDLGVAPIRESKVIETAEKVEKDAIDSLEGRLSARERAIEDIQRSIDEATSVVSAVDDEIASCADRVKEAMEATEEKRALTADLESNYLLHKQALGIVISSERPVEESEAELHKVLAAAKERMEQLQKEWEAAKAPLVQAIDAHAKAADEKRENAKIQLEEIEKWRSEGKETSTLLRAKEHEQRQLLEEYESAPKNVHRPSFVRRVNEIIKNIKKQEGEINKIVGDTRTVQREIQSAQELLERTYTVVEETLFREARSDDLCRQAYKHLHGMHSGFADLLAKVEATGAARRAQNDLQRKLTALSKQPNNSERVARDLSLIQEQIVELEAKLSSAA